MPCKEGHLGEPGSWLVLVTNGLLKFKQMMAAKKPCPFMPIAVWPAARIPQFFWGAKIFIPTSSEI